MHFRIFLAEVILNLLKHKQWRLGQAMFNTLYELAPTRADKIRGSGLDPFHNNSRILPFIQWIFPEDYDYFLTTPTGKLLTTKYNNDNE